MKKWLLNTFRGLPIAWLAVFFLILLFGNVISQHTVLVVGYGGTLVSMCALSVVAVIISMRSRRYGRAVAQLVLNGVLFVLCALSLVAMLVFSFDR